MSTQHLVPWRLALAAGYVILVVVVAFFGENEGIPLLLVTLPWSVPIYFGMVAMLMLAAMVGLYPDGLGSEAFFKLFNIILFGVSAGLNARLIAGIIQRRHFTFLDLHLRSKGQPRRLHE